MKKNNNKNQGQVALIVLMISAVVLTFGLSISKRTVSDTKVDADQELLKQAFDTAESGVDYYLTTGNTSYTSPDGKSTASVSVNQIGGGATLDYGEYLVANNNANVWLVAHRDNGTIDETQHYGGANLRLCVDNNATNNFSGALRVDFFYRQGGNVEVSHSGYNFGAGVVNNFADETGAGAGTCPTGMKGVDLDVSPAAGTTPLLLNIVPIGDGTNISVVSDVGEVIPSQGTEINSLGKTGNITSPMAVSRKVRVFKRYVLPSFMFDAITSGGSVIGN